MFYRHAIPQRTNHLFVCTTSCNSVWDNHFSSCKCCVKPMCTIHVHYDSIAYKNDCWGHISYYSLTLLFSWWSNFKCDLLFLCPFYHGLAVSLIQSTALFDQFKFSKCNLELNTVLLPWTPILFRGPQVFSVNCYVLYK
jgi:hypothetical protein